ncbi:Uncharacterised protein [Mycobacterium tuberculosis]|nr:Uncharacterised protein [Mycobacterium tuberculosis]
MSLGSLIVRRTIFPGPLKSNQLWNVSWRRRYELMTCVMARISHRPGTSQDKMNNRAISLPRAAYSL